MGWGTSLGGEMHLTRAVPQKRHGSRQVTVSRWRGGALISAHHPLPARRRLGLGMCQAGPAGGRLLAALAAAPALEALAVDLSHNRLRDSGLAALADLRHSGEGPAGWGGDWPPGVEESSQRICPGPVDLGGGVLPCAVCR